ncbi:MAG: pentapeptide repeat-containing protein [Cyanobacteria bacterium P01_B01_bin.77]
MDRPGLHISQPIAVWNRPLNANFKDLFKALGKGSIDAATGQWIGFGKDIVDASAALGLGNSPGQTAWLLVYRSLARAMEDLVEDSKELLITYPEDLEQLCNSLDLSLEDTELVIDHRFFDQPQNLPLLDAVQIPLVQFLEPFLSNIHQAQSIASRLPSYFIFALDQEWRQRAQEYSSLIDNLETPFTQAGRREQEWRLYSAWLQKQINEPMFLEAFGLRQIYVPQLAYYRHKIDDADTRFGYQGKNYEQVVVDLETDLANWLQSTDKTDVIRIVSGGPGSGKSSFAKVFAANQSTQKNRVLFIPLHQFDPTGDLEIAIAKFIQYGNFLSTNPLDFQYMSEQLLIIFDGLDELALQGRIAKEVAQSFIREVQRKVERYNQHNILLKVLITGREIVVQDNSSEFRQPRQILYLLPYCIPEDQSKKDDSALYIDPHQWLTKDRRQDWWRLYGSINGQSYTGLPPELDRGNLIEITAQPLLNYLVALSYTQGKLAFGAETNLNQIYYSLLQAVYERGYERNRRHAALQGMTQRDFIRILEEIALASWHGDGRTTTVKEIEAHCDNSGLRSLLRVFEEGAQAGVTRLLAAFYFRQSGGLRDGERTFEFTHKSFGEYLTARRIVRCIDRIHMMMQRRTEDIDEGWDTREGLVYWAKICASPTSMSYYLFEFVKDEIRLQQSERVAQWQTTLVKLVNFLMRHWMPMERLTPRDTTFRNEAVRARHAEEALFAVLNACACVTQKISNIQWRWPGSFGGLLGTLLGQQLTNDENPVILHSLGYLNLKNCTLIGRNLRNADLTGADLTGANLSNSNLYGANLQKTTFQSVNLTEANLRGADLCGVTMKDVNLAEANLRGANLQKTTLQTVNLAEANLCDADLCEVTMKDVNLAEANLRGANLQKTTLQTVNLAEASLFGADLKEIDWQDVNLDKAHLDKAKYSIEAK